MVLTSFRRGSRHPVADPSFLPTPGTLDNYRKVFERDYFWTAMRNSLMVTADRRRRWRSSSPSSPPSPSPGSGSAAARRSSSPCLIVQMIPAEALIISMFRVLDGWQLTNTVIGLSLTYLVFVLPFTIWTLRGFVGRRAVRARGGGAWSTAPAASAAFRRITLPLVAPGLVATGIFAFIQAWNEFIFALVIMNRPEHQTLPVWLQAFNEGARGTDWGGVMAGSTLMALPVIMFFLIVQRRVTAGLTAGAVKG